MSRINKGDEVLIKGFVEDYCFGKMPPPGSWQYQVYMAEIDREVCIIRDAGECRQSCKVYIPSRNDSWWVKKEFIKPYSGLEREATEF